MYLPSRFEIAKHWVLDADACLRRYIVATDMGEPCCFACGYYADVWDKRYGVDRWNRTSLQRAHLVPRSLGGADSVENLVLLCFSCHEESPDYADSGEMLEWMSRRENWTVSKFQRIMAACAAIGVTGDDIESFYDQPDESRLGIVHQAVQKISKHLSFVGKGLKPSTFALAMRDAIQIDLDTF